MPANLAFTRSHPYEARSETLTYRIHQSAEGWELTIFRPGKSGTIFDGNVLVKDDWHARKAYAVAVARRFESLGDDYKSFEHGYRERITEATLLAYDNDL
jgi:hypothetical protein